MRRLMKGKKLIPKLPFTNVELSLLINRKEGKELASKLTEFRGSNTYKFLRKLDISRLKVADSVTKLTKKEQQLFNEYVAF
jgi:hypothetical protein